MQKRKKKYTTKQKLKQNNVKIKTSEKAKVCFQVSENTELLFQNDRMIVVFQTHRVLQSH